MVLLIALSVALPSHSQMYKCVDERGVTHYTDKPRPGCKGGPVDIRSSPSITGTELRPRGAPDVARQEADFRRRNIAREQAETEERQARAQRCGKLRSEYNVLAAGTRVYRFNQQGERVFVEDGSRDARVAQLKDQLRTCP